MQYLKDMHIHVICDGILCQGNGLKVKMILQSQSLRILKWMISNSVW